MRYMPNSPYQVGSLYLINRGGYFYIHGTADGRRIRAATKTTDLRVAKKALDDIASEFATEWRDGAKDASIPWHAVAKWICQRHRTSAKERGIPFEINAADVYRALREADFRCSISGIALSRRVGPNQTPDPWSASLDRIENRHGYMRDNIRIVCLAANLAMNRWGFDTLLRLSSAVVQNSAKAQPEMFEILTPIEHSQTEKVVDANSQVIDIQEELAA